MLFDPCPGQVDIEEEQKDTKAHDGGLRTLISTQISAVIVLAHVKAIIFPAQLIYKKMSINLQDCQLPEYHSEVAWQSVWLT